jgi:hypothetical protein
VCGEKGEQPSSAAAAALNDKKLLKTNTAAAVGCSDWLGGGASAPVQRASPLVRCGSLLNDVNSGAVVWVFGRTAV